MFHPFFRYLRHVSYVGEGKQTFSAEAKRTEVMASSGSPFFKFWREPDADGALNFGGFPMEYLLVGLLGFFWLLIFCIVF